MNLLPENAFPNNTILPKIYIADIGPSHSA